MKSFTDAKGNTWTIEVNVTTLQRVKGLTGINLTNLIDAKGDTFTKVVEDVFVMFDVLTALVRPQLDAQGMTTEQFGESLDETSLEAAVHALIEAVIDFFREGKRTLLKRAFTKVKTAAERRQSTNIDKAMQAVESPEFDQAIENALQSTSGN
ncbi:hypothetical protein [Thalassoglobus sp.]|uniref:hypothetical protein n=1 Tax=Thalassoglobus sp. TaxID=2795869 RepID=UPI003AA7EC51